MPIMDGEKIEHVARGSRRPAAAKALLVAMSITCSTYPNTSSRTVGKNRKSLSRYPFQLHALTLCRCTTAPWNPGFTPQPRNRKALFYQRRGIGSRCRSDTLFAVVENIDVIGKARARPGSAGTAPAT